MRKAINIAGCILLCLFIASCKRRMNAADYVRYISDSKNGITKTTIVDGFEYRIQYRTHQYIVLAETKGKAKKSDAVKRTEELKGAVWFNISIKRTDNAYTILRYGVKSVEDYNTRLNYYLNEASQDIKLTYGQDTLHAASYLFENNYNLSPQETMVVSFILPNNEDYPTRDMRLSFLDRVFNNGIINASFPIEIINKIPTLEY